jgi:diguanylate cyclase (GGDEF)-like protein
VFERGGDRVVALQLVRLLGATVLLVVPLVTHDDSTELRVLTIAYVIAIGLVELVRRRSPASTPRLMSGMVLVDGLVVALAIAMTGEYHSPLLFLVFLDVMAVTVLASYRTGLKLAVWCALLLLLAHAAADAGILSTGTTVSDTVAIVTAATFLLFASCAAGLSWVTERALRRGNDHLEQLVRLGAELERAERLDTVIAVLARHARARLGFERAAVVIRRDGSWIGAVDDRSVGVMCELSDRTHPLVRLAWNAKKPLLLRSLDDDLLDDVVPLARNCVIAPIVVDDEPIGVALGEWGGGREARIPTFTVHALSQAASHTGLALRNVRLLEKVQRLATRDALTGLANRRLFEDALTRETARSQRLGQPLSLVLLDVDYFKEVNDTFGHTIGDAVLGQVADAIRTRVKGFDVAARYGGDEFVLLLPGCSAADAVGVAERVRSRVANAVDAAPVTMTAGVATMPQDALDGERLVTAADRALYAAKRAGRDRVGLTARASLVGR